MTPLGKILRVAKAIRVYKNGDGHGFVWRWWNPVSWAVAPLAFIGGVLVQGLPETVRYKHDLGFGMSPWFLEHPERLEWLP